MAKGSCGEQPPFKDLFVLAVNDHPIVFGILFGIIFIAIGFLVHNFKQFRKEIKIYNQQIIESENSNDQSSVETKKDK